MRLYEYDINIQKIQNEMDKWAESHDGDITDFPYSNYEEILKEGKDEKLLNIACWVKSLNAESLAINNEEDILKKRRQTIDNKVKSLRGLIEKYFPVSVGKISNAQAVLSYRKSENVIIDDEEKLPIFYYRVKQEPILSDIKKDIDKLKGIAHIQENYNLQIK